MKKSLKIDNTDHNREGMTGAKLVHGFKVIFNKQATNTLESVNKFAHIDFEKHMEEGKKGIILDIDDCIAPHHGRIYPTNIIMIKHLLKKGWNIVIFSNMKKSGRYKELEELGIKVITGQYAKPHSKGFEECLIKMNLDAKEVMMVGDNFLTDGGSIGAGIDFIKVRPIEIEEKNPSIGRNMQKTMRSFADKVAKVRGNI